MPCVGCKCGSGGCSPTPRRPPPGSTVLLTVTKQVGVVSDEEPHNPLHVRVKHIGVVPMNELQVVKFPEGYNG